MKKLVIELWPYALMETMLSYYGIGVILTSVIFIVMVVVERRVPNDKSTN